MFRSDNQDRSMILCLTNSTVAPATMQLRFIAVPFLVRSIVLRLPEMTKPQLSIESTPWYYYARSRNRMEIGP